LRTYLAVFAVCLIYFAQDFALVGAGSVSHLPTAEQISCQLTATSARTTYRRPVWTGSGRFVDHSNDHHPYRCPRSHCFPSIGLLGTKMVFGHPHSHWCRWCHHRIPGN
jgi:hypothetical protein